MHRRSGRDRQYQDYNRYGRFREESDEDRYSYSRPSRSGNYEDSNEQDWSRQQGRESNLGRNMRGRQGNRMEDFGDTDDEEDEYRFPGRYRQYHENPNEKDYQGTGRFVGSCIYRAPILQPDVLQPGYRAGPTDRRISECARAGADGAVAFLQRLPLEQNGISMVCAGIAVLLVPGRSHR